MSATTSDGVLCIKCGTKFHPAPIYVGAYCPDCHERFINGEW